MKYLIETDRLVLRDLEPRDEGTLAAMLADEEVMRWIGAGGAQGGDAVRRVIERARGRSRAVQWMMPTVRRPLTGLTAGDETAARRGGHDE